MPAIVARSVIASPNSDLPSENLTNTNIFALFPTGMNQRFRGSRIREVKFLTFRPVKLGE